MVDSRVRGALLIGLTWLWADMAVAQLQIEITEYAGKQTPIAIVPFGFEGETPTAPLDVDDVIAADLQRSGRFAPIDEANMLQRPTTGVEVDFDDWSILGVEAVVVGRITQTDANAYSVQFQTVRCLQTRTARRLPHARESWHDAAHGAPAGGHDL